MNPQPIPCAHCGVNFMRHNLDPEAPKLCNNCKVREEDRKPKGEPKMSTIRIAFEVSLDLHKQIEETCINEGLTLSQYFAKLHEANMSRGWKWKEPTQGSVSVEKEYSEESNKIETNPAKDSKKTKSAKKS